LEVEESLWEKGIRKDASAKGLGPCDRIKRRVHTKEGKGVFVVKRRKGRGASVCGGSTAKRVHSALKVPANITSALCGKKGWQKKDGTRLLPYKPVDDKKRIPIATYCRHTGWSKEKEGVYKVGSKIGLQQCPNQGGRRMEGSIHYAYRSIL